LSELKLKYNTYGESFTSLQSQLPEALQYHEKNLHDQKCLKDIKEAIEKHIKHIKEMMTRM